MTRTPKHDRWSIDLDLERIAREADGAVDGNIVISAHEARALVALTERANKPLLRVDSDGNVEIVRCQRCARAVDELAAALSISEPPPGVRGMLESLRQHLAGDQP